MRCEAPTNRDDFFDMRDAIARYEEIEAEETRSESDEAEFKSLKELLDETRSNGGDEQWRGDWYPAIMIRDSYFKVYAQEFAEEIGFLPADARWPATCIDWEEAARELQCDYSRCEFDGVTYWYR